MIETEEQIGGVRLEPEEVFSFACHPGLACFNTCCARKRLPVLPYDLLRLRRGLGLTSQEILASHLELEEDPVSGWPALRLKLTEEGRCPFVGPQGCGVYLDRPAACRTYPLARAVAPGDGGQPPRELFLRQEAPGCLGWQEARPLSLAQWVAEQELSPYQEANDRLLGLLLHPRRRGRLHLSLPQTHAVILALYNLDMWRQAVAQEGFAGLAGLRPQAVQAALASDEDLLDLGQQWLITQLFGPPIAPRPKQGKARRR